MDMLLESAANSGFVLLKNYGVPLFTEILEKGDVTSLLPKGKIPVRCWHQHKTSVSVSTFVDAKYKVGAVIINVCLTVQGVLYHLLVSIITTS